MSQQPKRHLDQVIHFCWHKVVSDRQTHTPRYICSKRPHLRTSYMRKHLKLFCEKVTCLWFTCTYCDEVSSTILTSSLRRKVLPRRLMLWSTLCTMQVRFTELNMSVAITNTRLQRNWRTSHVHSRRKLDNTGTASAASEQSPPK